MSIDLGELYAASRHRITDLIMSSPHETWDQLCPATPEWSVHDVVAHCRGITEDVRTGNIGEAGTDPWTADQVARHRETSMTDLLTGWSDDASLLEGFLSSPDGPSAANAVVDVHTHEADIRSALGRPPVLPEPFAVWAMEVVTAGFFEAVGTAGLAPVQIKTTEDDHLGPEDADVVLRVSRFEWFRARLGRRSPGQVLAYEWSTPDASPYLEHLFIFGPRTTGLFED